LKLLGFIRLSFASHICSTDSIPWVHHSREEGSLDYDGRLVRCKSQTNFDTIINRQQQRSVPPTWGARRLRSSSSTRAGKPKMATPATSSTPGGWATRRRGQRRTTTLDGVGTTIAGRTARRRRCPREPVCSARRSARRASPSASISPHQSTNTTGRRTHAYGSTITSWRVSWAGPPPTR
jgi:hypothetical protein